MVSYEVIVQLIKSTKTVKGLEVACEMDKEAYETGINITPEKMEEISIERSSFHGEWNYTIWPQT